MNAIDLVSESLTYSKEKLVKVKDSKSGLWRNVPKDEARGYPFIYGNISKLGLIVVDVDDAEVDGLCEGMDESVYYQNDIPVPLYAINTSGARFQCAFALTDPLPLPKHCSSLSLDYYRAIREKLIFRLNGDFALPFRGWMRNPLYESARIRHFHGSSYKLGDLDIPTIDGRSFERWSGDYVVGNRNRATFMFALGEFKASGDKLTFDVLMSRVQTFQALRSPVESLSLSENRGIVGSVLRNGGRYCAPGRRHDPSWNVGAMGLPVPDWGSMTAEEREKLIRFRQSLAAYHCHEVNKQRTIAKILESMEGMLSRGLPITIKGLAREACVSRNTVRGYWAELTGEVRA